MGDFSPYKTPSRVFGDHPTSWEGPEGANPPPMATQAGKPSPAFTVENPAKNKNKNCALRGSPREYDLAAAPPAR